MPAGPGSVIRAVPLQLRGIGGPEHLSNFPRGLEIVQSQAGMKHGSKLLCSSQISAVVDEPPVLISSF